MLLGSLALMALSLNTGLSGDDYVHIWMLRGAPGLPEWSRAPWDVFRFATPETTAALQARGILSWWADPEARLAFLRPISSLTHYVDHLLWPDQPWLMHLHSLAWAGVALSAVLSLYRRLLAPGWLLGLSFYLYALDDARAWFVSWVAGRNTVVATALSLWVLILYVRARQDGDRRALVASWLMLPISLLGGEGSLAICTYLFAHALWLESDAPLLRRLLRLWPYALTVVVWRVLYLRAGYGVSGSGLYVDPGGDPVGFLVAFVERMPILVFSQFGGAWSELWNTLFVLPKLKLAIAVQAVIAVLLYSYLLWPHFKRDRLTAFALTGGVLSLIPAAAAFPADRLLNWVALGMSLATARLIGEHLGTRGPGFRARLGAIVAAVVVMAQMVLGPVLLGSRARGNNGIREMLARVDSGVPQDESVRERHVVYMNPPAVPLAAYLPIMRGATGKPAPKSQIWLATGTGDITVERIGPRALRLSMSVGLLENTTSSMLRSPRKPFTLGEETRVDLWRLVVRELDEEAMPIAIEAHCDKDLDDPSLLFLAWEGTGYVPFEIPERGQPTRLPAVDYVEVLFGSPAFVDARHPSAAQSP